MKNFYKIPFLVCALLGIQNLSAQFYNLGQGISVTDVNDNLVAAASSANVNNIRWTKDTGVQIIGTVTRDLLAGQRLVGADNNKIIGYMTNPETNLNEPSIYDATTQTWKHLGGISSSSDASKASPWGMSEDGTTIVGLGWTSASIGHATKWEINGETVTITDMGSTETGRSSRANAISNDKSTIVGWQDDQSGFRQGAYWYNGVQTIIKNTAGSAAGESGAVSNDGKVMVGVNGFYPYVYNRETGIYTEITHPDAGTFFRGGATNISGDGKTVVGYFRGWPGGPHFGYGFIWTQESGRVDLTEYAQSLGIDTQGLRLSLPLSISPDGKKIAGQAVNPTTLAAYGFVLDLTTYLGTNASQKPNIISIYPNPAKDIVNIANTKNTSKIEIYNMTGQKILTSESAKTSIDVSQFPKGNYIVTITADGKTTSHKLVKE
ncbi:T9SS type A sorting domain-containing protein [Soonwooa purpurea]